MGRAVPLKWGESSRIEKRAEESRAKMVLGRNDPEPIA